MTLTVYTARVSFGGPDRLDITRKSGADDGLAFAPSWEILRPALKDLRRAEGMIVCAGEEAEILDAQNLRRRAWGAYSVAFRAEMRESFKRDRGPWDRLLALDRVVLVCYCTNPDFCHRTILATELLPAFGAKYGGEVERLAPRMRVAITANRDLARGDVARFEGPMAHLCGLAPEELIFGGARGGDTLALDLAGRLRDKDRTRLVVIVPDTVDAQPREAREAIRRWIIPGYDEVVELRQRITAEDNFEAFAVRNRAMIDRARRAESPFTLGFWNEDRRSGTYSALAYARRVECPLWIERIEGGDGR